MTILPPGGYSIDVGKNNWLFHSILGYQDGVICTDTGLSSRHFRDERKRCLIAVTGRNIRYNRVLSGSCFGRVIEINYLGEGHARGKVVITIWSKAI
jgi:hypothetical protein